MSDEIEQVRACLIKSEPPALRRVNGTGTTMLGSYHARALYPSYFVMVWITVFFVPAFPLGIYLIGHPTRNGRADTSRFISYGKVKSQDLARICPGSVPRLVGASLLHAALFIGIILAGIVGLVFVVTWWRGRL